MPVSRDVILDLLPLYIAGEASPATRELVDDFLREDPSLRELVRREAASLTSQLGAPTPAASVEVRALTRTRSLVAAQRWLFGISWFLTATTFSLRVRTGGGRIEGVSLALADFPAAFAAIVCAMALSWGSYFLLRRRTRL